MNHISISRSSFSNIGKQISNTANAIMNLGHTSKPVVKAQIAQTEVHNAPSYDLGVEINNFHEAVSQAKMKGNDGEISSCLLKFSTGVFKNCIRGKENGQEKMASANLYVNAVLDALDNNPKIANLCKEQLVNNLDSNLSFALINNPRFNITALNEKQANACLKNALSLVFNFVSTPPLMHQNICDLIKISNMSGNELEGLIEKSIAVKNLDLAEFMIKLNEGKLPKRESVMDRAIEEQDLDLVEFIVKHEGPRGAQELIKKCVDANLENFLENVLNLTDQHLTEAQSLEFSKQAHAQGNLSLMKSINPEWKELSISEFKHIPEEAKANKLTQYFLNSNKDDVKELLLLLKNNGLISDQLFNEANEFIENAGKLISRFPNPLHQQEVHLGYGKNYENYGQQQLEYGRRHLQSVNNVIKQIEMNPSKSLESVYLSLINSKEPNPWRMGVGETPILTRYTMFKKLAIEKLDRNYENPNVSKPDLDAFNISFTGNSPFKLTTIAATDKDYEPALRFYHSKPIFDTSVPKAERTPHWLDQIGISTDWNNLVNAKVDTQDPESVKQFESKVAEFYWKGVQLMPTVRGNSQTMLELHYILYKLKGLEPPTLSRYTVLPDCIALCSTLDEFKTRYDSCWDK